MKISKPVPEYLILIILTTLLLVAPVWSENLTNQTEKQNTSTYPDYAVSAVTLPPQSSWIDSGSYIQPNITLSNLGGEDSSGKIIQIEAFLGSYQLISKNNQVPPLKAGEVREIAPDYLIPNSVPSGDYSLKVVIDTENEKGNESAGNNEAMTQNQVNIKLAAPKAKVNNCGCS